MGIELSKVVSGVVSVAGAINSVASNEDVKEVVKNGKKMSKNTSKLIFGEFSDGTPKSLADVIQNNKYSSSQQVLSDYNFQEMKKRKKKKSEENKQKYHFYIDEKGVIYKTKDKKKKKKKNKKKNKKNKKYSF